MSVPKEPSDEKMKLSQEGLIAVKNKPTELAKQVSELREENRKLKEEKEKLTKQLEVRNSIDSGKQQQLLREKIIEELQTEFEEFIETSVAEKEAAYREQLEKIDKESKNKIEKLNEEIQNLKKEGVSKFDHKSKMDLNVRWIGEGDNRGLKLSIESWIKKINEEIQDVEENSNQIASVTSLSGTAQNELNTLQKQKKYFISKVKSAVEEVQKLSQELDEKYKELFQGKNVLAWASIEDDKMADFKAKLEALEITYEQVSRVCNAGFRSWKQADQIYLAMVASFQEEFTKLSHHNEKLNQEIAALRRAKNEKAQELENQDKQMKTELEKVAKEAAKRENSLKAKLDNALKNKEELKEELEVACKQNRDLAEQLKSKTVSVQQQFEINQKNKALSEEAQEKLLKAQQIKNQTAGELQTLQEQVVRLKTDLEKATELNRQLQAELAREPKTPVREEPVALSLAQQLAPETVFIQPQQPQIKINQDNEKLLEEARAELLAVKQIKDLTVGELQESQKEVENLKSQLQQVTERNNQLQTEFAKKAEIPVQQASVKITPRTNQVRTSRKSSIRRFVPKQRITRAARLEDLMEQSPLPQGKFESFFQKATHYRKRKMEKILERKKKKRRKRLAASLERQNDLSTSKAPETTAAAETTPILRPPVQVISEPSPQVMTDLSNMDKKYVKDSPDTVTDSSTMTQKKPRISIATAPVPIMTHSPTLTLYEAAIRRSKIKRQEKFNTEKRLVLDEEGWKLLYQNSKQYFEGLAKLKCSQDGLKKYIKDTRDTIENANIKAVLYEECALEPYNSDAYALNRGIEKLALVTRDKIQNKIDIIAEQANPGIKDVFLMLDQAHTIYLRTGQKEITISDCAHAPKIAILMKRLAEAMGLNPKFDAATQNAITTKTDTFDPKDYDPANDPDYQKTFKLIGNLAPFSAQQIAYRRGVSPSSNSF